MSLTWNTGGLSRRPWRWRAAEVNAGRVYEIAPEDLRQYVNPEQPDAFKPREAALPPGPVPKWRFPAGSVTAVELDLRQI